MPYGLGRTCLDTHLVLLDPNGTVVSGNNIVKDTAQSMLKPYAARANEWGFAREDSMFPAGATSSSNTRAAPTRLALSGTYTVRVGSHTGRVADGASHVSQKLSPVGGYYVTIDKVGSISAAKDFTCPEVPPEVVAAGNEKRGCANILWASTNTYDNPYKAYRHQNCELHTPQRRSGSNLPTFHNHRVLKSGVYALRVRFNQNSATNLRVPVAPFKAGLVTTATPLSNADAVLYQMRTPKLTGSHWSDDVVVSKQYRLRESVTPATPTTATVPNVTYGDGGVFFDANCAGVPLNAQCVAPQGVLTNTQCYASTKWFDKNENEQANEMEVTHEFRVRFAGVVGDVVCITAAPKTPGSGVLAAGSQPRIVLQKELTASTHEFIAFAETTLGGGSAIADAYSVTPTTVAPVVPSDAGIGMFAQTLSATATYTALVTGFASSETPLVKVFKCPEEKTTFGSTITDLLTECRARKGLSTWDKCASPDGTPVSFDTAGTTVTVGGTAKTYARVYGNTAFDITGNAATDKLYWEITVGVTSTAVDTNFEVGIASFNMKFGEFFKFTNNGTPQGGPTWLGKIGFVRPGDVLMFAVDLENNKMWGGRNGFWDGGSAWHDTAGTRFNNFDKNGDQLAKASDLRNFSLCAGHNFFDCRKPPATWDASNANTQEGYYHCCPFRQPATAFGANAATGVNTAFWTNDFHLPTESYPYPTNNWISAALGNPVNDGEGSITTNGGAQHSAYNGDDLETESKLFAPVVIGRMGQTFTINHGKGPFAYTIPCGYKPLSDLAADDATTTTTSTVVVTASCWTVGGLCDTFILTGTNSPTCTAFASTTTTLVHDSTDSSDRLLYSGNGDWAYYYGAAGMTVDGATAATWNTIQG